MVSYSRCQEAGVTCRDRSVSYKITKSWYPHNFVNTRCMCKIFIPYQLILWQWLQMNISILNQVTLCLSVCSIQSETGAMSHSEQMQIFSLMQVFTEGLLDRIQVKVFNCARCRFDGLNIPNCLNFMSYNVCTSFQYTSVHTRNSNFISILILHLVYYHPSN